MLEPAVQYARTSDGVNIAYVTFGEPGGKTPLVCLRPPQLSHMGLEFKLPFETRWHEFETLSRDRLVVRFDSRACGLSDRGVKDISLEARCRDIDAVADRLGLEQFALQGQLHSGTWAIAYAAANPSRVSRLILVQAYTDARDYWSIPGRAALQPLAAIDWTTYTEASMSNAFGWAPGDLPRALAAQMRASVTQEDFVAFLEFEKTCDVSHLMREVRCPVLVVHFQLNAVTTQDIARRIAASATDGRLLMPRDFRESLRVYQEFLDEEPERVDAAEHGEADEPPLRVFLVAHADTRPGQVERVISATGGTPVSSMAGMTASLFASAQDALLCAEILSRQTGAAVGIHAGEPGADPAEEADPSLVVAVRAAGEAGPGHVVVSNVVRELAAGKGFTFEALYDGEGDPSDPLSPRLFMLRRTPGGGSQ